MSSPKDATKKAEYIENKSKALKDMWADPKSVFNSKEFIERHRITCTKAANKPEVKERKRLIVKNAHNDPNSGFNKPGYKEKQRKAHLGKQLRENASNWQGGKTFLLYQGKLQHKDIIFEQLSKEQKGVCRICGRDQYLVLDHNHKTNAARGVLCSRCNTGLGKFLDNPEIMLKAIKYLGE